MSNDLYNSPFGRPYSLGGLGQLQTTSFSEQFRLQHEAMKHDMTRALYGDEMANAQQSPPEQNKTLLLLED